MMKSSFLFVCALWLAIASAAEVNSGPVGSFDHGSNVNKNDNINNNNQDNNKLNIRKRQLQDEEPEPRIIGGTTVAAGTYPWYVLFPSGACGGTLISPNRVLTSATCVKTQNPQEVRVSASTTTNGEVIPVECTKIHPSYYRTETGIYNDLAIIKLLRSTTARSVAYNGNPMYPDNDSRMTMTTMGFGFQSTSGPLSTTLQVAQVDLVPIRTCQIAFGADGTTVVVDGQHFCARSNNTGVCTGDSGGPLMDGSSVFARQVGVSSFTYGNCANPTFPDVYTDIATYVDWIQSQLTTNMCDDIRNTLPPGTTATGGTGTTTGTTSEDVTLSPVETPEESESVTKAPTPVVAEQSPTPQPTLAPTATEEGSKCLFTLGGLFALLSENIAPILQALDNTALEVGADEEEEEEP